MLSATIPNYMDFAKWVGRIKNTTVINTLIYTNNLSLINYLDFYPKYYT